MYLDIPKMFTLEIRLHFKSQCLNLVFYVDCWLEPILFYFLIWNMYLAMNTKLLLAPQFKSGFGAKLYSQPSWFLVDN
jgi:hypothetical protein